MIDQIKRILNSIGHGISTFIGSLSDRILNRQQDNVEKAEQPPSWLDHEDADPVDEAAWESFPSSDPPAFTRDS